MKRFTYLVGMLSLVLSLPAGAQNCTPDNIVLGSQADVDDFQADHGPCDHVVGILEGSRNNSPAVGVQTSCGYERASSSVVA